MAKTTPVATATATSVDSATEYEIDVVGKRTRLGSESVKGKLKVVARDRRTVEDILTIYRRADKAVFQLLSSRVE